MQWNSMGLETGKSYVAAEDCEQNFLKEQGLDFYKVLGTLEMKPFIGIKFNIFCRNSPIDTVV